MKSHQLLILLAGYLALSPCVTAQDATEPPGVMISPGSAAGREPRVDYEAERTRATEALNELEAKYQGLESYHIQARKVGTVQRTRVEEATSVWKEHEPEQGARWRMELEIVRQIEERPPINGIHTLMCCAGGCPRKSTKCPWTSRRKSTATCAASSASPAARTCAARSSAIGSARRRAC
jgi:hypothetical protein